MVTPTVTTKVNNSNYDVSADQWNALIAATKNQGYSYIIYKSGSTYYARNGATGAVDYSSTDDDTVFISVFATTPSSVYVATGAYSASLTVPANTYLKADSNVTGILYSSIGDGARIDEPAFNSCFGGHVQGKYTIAVGTTAMVGAKRTYLIFDSNNCVVTSSTSFDAMIQDFFDDVVDDSGIEIFIRSGEYFFNAGVTISNKNLVLTGEVEDVYSAKRDGVLFISLVNVDSLLTFSQSVKTDVNLYVKNIALYGWRASGRTGNGLNLTNLTNVHFENVAIEYFDGAGIILDNVEQGYFKDMFLNQNTVAGVKTSYFIGEIHFERSQIIYCGRVWLSQDHQTSVIRFINNQFYHNTLPILFSNNVSDTVPYSTMGEILFTGNNLHNEEIVLEGNVKHVRISLNRFRGTDTVITTLSRDGYEPSGVYVTDNMFTYNSGGAPSVVFVAGTTGVVRGNDGFVTENSGTGSIASGATSAVIAHGCNYTPTAADIVITLTEKPTNTPGAIWVDTIGSANFTVNCENDPGASNLDFSWSVRKV